MPKRKKKPAKRKKPSPDANQLAASILRQATANPALNKKRN
jgi:hypothetical protein